MKIQELLITEKFDFDNDTDTTTGTGFKAPKISVADLNSLQINTLNRLKDGRVSIDSASEKELDVIMDLIDIGLVDAEGNVTDSGEEAADAPNLNVDVVDGKAVDFESSGEEISDIDFDDNEDLDIDSAFR